MMKLFGNVFVTERRIKKSIQNLHNIVNSLRGMVVEIFSILAYYYKYVDKDIRKSIVHNLLYKAY